MIATTERQAIRCPLCHRQLGAIEGERVLVSFRGQWAANPEAVSCWRRGCPGVWRATADRTDSYK